MRMNLGLGLFWLAASGTLLIALALDRSIGGMSPSRQMWIGLFGLVLAAYNGVRWWASRQARVPRPHPPAPPPRQRTVTTPPEYNPDLDFTKE